MDGSKLRIQVSKHCFGYTFSLNLTNILFISMTKTRAGAVELDASVASAGYTKLEGNKQ
jgi:hypothetical protein